MVFSWDLSWGLVWLRGRHPDPHPISLRRSSHVGTLHDLLLIKKPHKYSAAVNISSLTNEVIKQPRPHRGWIHFNNRVSEFLVHNRWSARRCDSEESVCLRLCVSEGFVSNTKHSVWVLRWRWSEVVPTVSVTLNDPSDLWAFCFDLFIWNWSLVCWV